ncbi:MAG: sn-glycerol-3-phosphate ABC transporter substrate-binding protein UgpB [Clostridia bacterium]
MRRLLVAIAALAAGLLCAASTAFAAEEIRVWHAMSGAAGAELDELAGRFNASQKEFRVVPVYKGTYDQTLAAALAARKQAAGPHIVQVYEVGTADIMSVKDAVRPLWQVMHEAGVEPESKFVPAIAGYYSDTHGRLLALPFNTATPVLFYNRDAFKRAKLDPGHPPQTWYEMPTALGALRESGVSCPFTTAWPSWVLLENMSAWHNQEFATYHNGMDSPKAKLSFNTRLMMRWISMLSSWMKSGYFVYSGRGNEAEARFASGECAVLTSSSASVAELRQKAKFDFGVAQLPYYDDFAGSPQNTLVGGAGLWVMSGKPKGDYAGVARFLAFLSRPDVQAEWHQKTGYVPATINAYEISRKEGFYASNPGQEIAMKQLLLKNPTGESKGIRLGHFPKIRLIIDEELEAVWGNKKTPLEALNSAVKRGNVLLDRFARNEPVQ